MKRVEQLDVFYHAIFNGRVEYKAV